MKIFLFTQTESLSFEPFMGRQKIYGNDLIIVNDERFLYDPRRPRPKLSGYYITYEPDEMFQRTMGITLRDHLDDLLPLEKKILSRIRQNEKIILFDDMGSFYDEHIAFFNMMMKNKPFELHVIKTADHLLESNDYHELLRVTELGGCKSVCYLNYNNPYEDHDKSIKYDRNMEGHFYKELEHILGEIGNNDFTEFRIYDHEAKKYIPCDTPPVCDDSLFEFISPSGISCQEFYNFRKEYAEKNRLEYHEESCDECIHRDECRHICRWCDYRSKALWEEVHPDDDSYENEITAKINGIDRMRVNTDGNGIRALVLMANCPLNCRYCGNRHIRETFPLTTEMNVWEFADHIKKDCIYFEKTGGGITFGGGEPLLQYGFIHEIKKCYPMWSINIETSLCCDISAIDLLADDIGHWYVDIKDMDPDIYKRYTGGDIQNMLTNLKHLISVVPADRITVRIPLIPEYNTEEDILKSEAIIREMGFTDTDIFTYSVM